MIAVEFLFGSPVVAATLAKTNSGRSVVAHKTIIADFNTSKENEKSAMRSKIVSPSQVAIETF